MERQMETQNNRAECISPASNQIVVKIILLGISLFFALRIGDSLRTNLLQGDDAWIGDAIMLLGVAIIVLGVLIGKPRKSAPAASANIDQSSDSIGRDEQDASELKDSTETDPKPIETKNNTYIRRPFC